MADTTVGDTYLIDTMTFEAAGGYTLVGSTVKIKLWYGRIASPTFAIELTDASPGVTWNTAAGTLDINIQPADWSTFAPRVDVELLCEVEITLANGVVQSFRPLTVAVQDQAIAS